MIYHKVICACGWLLNSWAEWSVYPDRTDVVEGLCGLCLMRVESENEPPPSWFGRDLGEAGA